MEVLCPILGRLTEVDVTAFTRDKWSIVRCQETGFVFLKNPPDYSQLETTFAWEVTAGAERKRRREAEPFVSRLSLIAASMKLRLFPNRNRYFTLAKAHLPEFPSDAPIRILDVGCGKAELLQDLHGRFLAENLTIIPQGIEVSPHLADLANQCVASLGGCVIQENAVDGTSRLPPNSVDIAIMSSFLEHECQPLVLLRQLHSVITERGVIVLKVPNFGCVNRMVRGSKWCGFRFPDHTNYFTPTTLTRIADEAGFDCRQTVMDKLPFSDNMYAVLKKKTALLDSVTFDQPNALVVFPY
jgi:SAM-dependent methyltransferase